MSQSARWKWQLEWLLITETGSTYQKLFSKSCVHIWQESSSDSIKLRAKYMLKERDSAQPLHNLQFRSQPTLNSSCTQNYNSVSHIFSHTYLNSCKFWGFHRGAFEDVTLLLGTWFLKFVGRNVSNHTWWCGIVSLNPHFFPKWTHIFLVISSSYDVPKFPTVVDTYHTMLPSGMWCWVVHCFILLTSSLSYFPIQLHHVHWHVFSSSSSHLFAVNTNHFPPCGYLFYHEGRGSRFLKILVHIHWTTRHHIPQGSNNNLHSQCQENVTCHERSRHVRWQVLFFTTLLKYLQTYKFTY